MTPDEGVNDAQILAIALAEETCKTRRLLMENAMLKQEIERLKGGNVTVMHRTDVEYPVATPDRG